MDKVTRLSISHNFLKSKERAEVLLLTSLAPYRWATPAHRVGGKNKGLMTDRDPWYYTTGHDQNAEPFCYSNKGNYK